MYRAILCEIDSGHLPQTTVQREEDADGGRPVEGAAADAHEEAGRPTLLVGIGLGLGLGLGMGLGLV